jgi:hypothetical protein
MYAMNLNFKLTSKKSKLAHYEENMKALYTFYGGVSKCVLIQCVMKMTGYAFKENLCWLQNPETLGLCSETPKNVSGVSGYITGVSGPPAQNTENKSHYNSNKHHTII